jgi:hypothetical protein
MTQQPITMALCVPLKFNHNLDHRKMSGTQRAPRRIGTKIFRNMPLSLLRPNCREKLHHSKTLQISQVTRANQACSIKRMSEFSAKASPSTFRAVPMLTSRRLGINVGMLEAPAPQCITQRITKILSDKESKKRRQSGTSHHKSSRELRY